MKIRTNTKIIVSYHNFERTSPLKELESIYAKIKAQNPDIIKIITFARSINDNFKIFKLLKDRKNLISFCMGLKGEISRIIAKKYGSYMIYASLEKEKVSAPGQISIEEMKNVYNINLINQATKVFGVISEFAENSYSKYMHNKMFKAKKLGCIYLPFKVGNLELKEFIKNLRDFGFSGASVTIPHKVEVINHLDSIDKTAEQIGAVNTLVNNNGNIIGYNTDHYGAVQALKEKTELDNKKVLVIGAGGAAMAIVYGLNKEDAEITIANRTFEKAKSLADKYDAEAVPLENMKNLVTENQIIINATSVGMHPNSNESIIKQGELIQARIVMDIVYKPRISKFVSFAKNAKCDVITGDRMLIYQGMRQFKLWTGKEADFRLMESALIERLKSE